MDYLFLLFKDVNNKTFEKRKKNDVKVGQNSAFLTKLKIYSINFLEIFSINLSASIYLFEYILESDYDGR